MGTKYRSICGAFAVFLTVLGVTSASSQSAKLGCSLEQITGTVRHVLHCGKGIKITVERGARYSLVDRNQDGDADGILLRRKALLIEVQKRQTSGFVVITPQAIAAVRGTKWATDVQAGKTSVFVVNGRVAVTKTNSGGSVRLGAGEGVDVERGTDPLVVKRWPPARVSALMARLGE